MTPLNTEQSDRISSNPNASNLPRYMVPKQIEVLPTLPTTVSGKVDYPTLRLRELQAA